MFQLITKYHTAGICFLGDINLHLRTAQPIEIDEMRMAIGTTYSIYKRHVVNLGYLLDLKRSAGGLDKVLHVITVGYVYKM